MVLLLDVRWIEFFLFLFLDQIAEGVDVSLWNDCFFFFFGLSVKEHDIYITWNMVS